MFVIDINPIAFTIGTISVRWYGIMIALAILVLILWTLRAVRKEPSLSYDTVFTAALVAIPTGFVVSRLLHVIDLWGYYSQNPGQIFGFSGLSGLTIWGAVLGAALGIWVYSRVSNFQFGHLADITAPGVVLAQAIGRVGCTLNGCCYGAETDSFFGVIYTHPESYAPLGIPVYPTQVFEILYLLIVFVVLLGLRKRLKSGGTLFLVYLSLYSVWRLGIGFLREGTVFLLGLQQAQIVALVVLAIAIPLLVRQVKKARVELDTD